ncbi:MAG: STAS domain-containing protein [Clostridia bacterium]|nr:STAS domain-containing protein [Clostridia bacterium]MBO5911881.1 STAS domain-containing protein [Clostridia bacterium]
MIKDNLVFAFEKGTLRIFIIGEINHHNVAEMREKIDKKIRESSFEKVVLDLSKLKFVDSSGMGFIIGRNRALQEMGTEFVIENPNTDVLKLLKCAGVDRIIKIVDSK